MIRRKMMLAILAAIAVSVSAAVVAGGAASADPAQDKAHRAPIPCPKRTLCLWKHSNYAGKRIEIQGKGLSNQIANQLNNEVSSGYNRRSAVSYLYEGKHGEGDFFCFVAKEEVSYVGDAFNDVASSSRLTTQDLCVL